MNWTDTHCHLADEKIIQNFEDNVTRSFAAGVTKIINVAYNLKTTDLVLEQCQKYPTQLFPTLGIQPHDAFEYHVDLDALLKNKMEKNPQIIAIGEIGLDHYYTTSSMEKQIECFEYFLNLALQFKKPVIVHVRNTHKEVLVRLQNYAKKGGTGVIHCFSGTKEEAIDFMDLNFYISYSGIVTFKNAAVVQESAKITPSNLLLIETDSPYLAPMPMRGKVNEPSYLIHTANFVAQLKNIPKEDLCVILENNFRKLFL